MTEWAQLLAGPTTRTGLERGVWYRVDVHGSDGSLRVIGRDGRSLAIEGNLVRIVAQEPGLVTRVLQAEFYPVKPGERSPLPQHYGVCPRGHWLREVPEGDAEVSCPRCERSYRIEDEAHV